MATQMPETGKMQVKESQTLDATEERSIHPALLIATLEKPSSTRINTQKPPPPPPPAVRPKVDTDYSCEGRCGNCIVRFAGCSNNPPPIAPTVSQWVAPNPTDARGREEASWGTLWSGTSSTQYENAAIGDGNREDDPAVSRGPRQPSCPDGSTGGEDQRVVRSL